MDIEARMEFVVMSFPLRSMSRCAGIYRPPGPISTGFVRSGRIKRGALTLRCWYDSGTHEIVQAGRPGFRQGLRPVTAGGRLGGAKTLERRSPMYSSGLTRSWRCAVRAALIVVFVLAASVLPARAQSTAPSVFPISYVLSPDSRYEEGCFGPCECPIFFADGVKGGFTLSFSGFEPPFIVYDVKEILWSVPALSKTFTGSGRYLIGWKGTA